MRQSVAHGHQAVVFLLVVLRLVRLASVLERRGLVHQDGRGRHQRLRAVHSGVQRRGVHERLERRSGLPPREHVVELAYPVVAPSHQGFQRAGVGVEGDQGHLRLVGFRRRSSLHAVQLLYKVIHFPHA